jgi:predicted amidohydrolase YtcJ
MNDGSGGARPAQGWPGSGAGPRGRQPEPQRSVPRSTPGWIPGTHRLALLAAALAGTALLAVACGGSAKPVSAALTNYQKALAFSQCMRAHGEPGFPDPQPDGNLLINAQKDHLNGALMNSANKACQHLMPKSPPMTAAQQQELTARALKFVACMRAHGLPTFADPVVNSRGIEMEIPQGIAPNSPVLKNAQQACRHLLPFGPP